MHTQSQYILYRKDSTQGLCSLGRVSRSWHANVGYERLAHKRFVTLIFQNHFVLLEFVFLFCKCLHSYKYNTVKLQEINISSQIILFLIARMKQIK